MKPDLFLPFELFAGRLNQKINTQKQNRVYIFIRNCAFFALVEEATSADSYKVIWE
jgi:hypothetical protein